MGRKEEPVIMTQVRNTLMNLTNRIEVESLHFKEKRTEKDQLYQLYPTSGTVFS